MIIDKTMQILQEGVDLHKSTTNMILHVNWHHSEKLWSEDQIKTNSVLTSRFAAPLREMSARTTEIKRCISLFIVKDRRPFHVIENEGFRLLVNTLEPK